MKEQLRAIILIFLVAVGVCTYAIDGSEDIDQTIANLYGELQSAQKLADEEISLLQESRLSYWERIGELQNEMDKAVLILYSQDGGSLFSVGLASESLENICREFSREQVPFRSWLQAMTTVSNRHAYIRTALQGVHADRLQPKTRNYIRKSIVICDSLDAKFAAMRDSIAVDKQRYDNLSSEIDELKKINSEVVNQIRHQIFQENDLDFITLFTAFNYSDLDYFYGSRVQNMYEENGENPMEKKIYNWENVISIIAIIIAIIVGLALRYFCGKKSDYGSKRWYYAYLADLCVLIIGTYLMCWSLGLNDYAYHIQDIYIDDYFFMFWIVLSATLRLKRPGLGWSIAVYAPLFFLVFMLRELATAMTRSVALKLDMAIFFIFVSLWVLITLIIGFKRILKSDYLWVYSSVALIFISSALAFMGYYYLALMFVLFCVSVMTYLSALICIKHFFAKRLHRAGPILNLSLSYLIYPYFYIYVIVKSFNDVANVFNLNTWFEKLFDTPFVSLPQFGIISVSRLLLLISVGILVNYVIKLVKQILLGLDKEKFETGSRAVGVTLGTMLVWFGYGIFALLVLQINHSGVIAAIGGASLGLGFAMKETFENLISGLQLMSSRVRPGDLVECGNARGIIRRIGILSTQLQVEDGPIVSIPNRQLLSSTFTNLSLNHRREIRHIVFDISDDCDLELAKELMLEASQGIDGVVDHDMHYVVMRNTNSGIVRLDYKCWIDSAKYLRAEPAVREAIFRAFRAHGIKIADFSNELGLHVNSKIAATPS